MAKYNTKDIIQIFKEYHKTVDPGYEYRNSQDKVPYTCDKCGFNHTILLRNVMSGGYGGGYKDGCKNCKKYKIDYSMSLEKSFKFKGYEIIKIKGDSNKNCYIYYRCPFGHTYEIRKDYWYTGHKCPYCEMLKRNQSIDIRLFTFKGGAPITMCLIKEVAHDYGFRLLSVGKYDGNSNSKLNFECIYRGHKIKLSVNDLQNKKKCYECKREDLFKEIKKAFKDNDYTLLTNLEEEYEGIKTLLECIHNECGCKFKTSWERFGYHKNRCPECAREMQGKKKSGSNHFNWKGGKSSEPYPFGWNDKKFKEYIFERDEYRCQYPNCKGKSNRLIRHHIDYNKENCDPMNIITLCCSCHTLTNYNRDEYEKYFKSLMKTKFGKVGERFINE